MPYPTGKIFAVPTVVNERVITAKFQPVGNDTTAQYVNFATGNDNNVGDVDHPFKTIPKAINYCANLAGQEVARIILQGASEHKIPEDYVFPFYGNSDIQGTDATQDDGFTQTAPIIIMAEPTLEQTITALQIVSQVADATSGLRLLTTDQTFVLNEFALMWLVDANGVIARILSNTDAVGASALTVANSTLLVGPVEIFSQSAIISGVDPTSTVPTLYLRGNAQVILQGVEVEPNTGGSVKVDRGANLTAIACQLNHVILGEDDAQTPGYLNLQGCLLGDFELNAGGLKLSRSIVDDTDVTGAVTGFLRGVSVDAQQCYFDSMASSLFSDGTVSVSALSLDSCELLDCPARGVLQVSGQLLASQVKVLSAALAGIQVAANGLALLSLVAGANDTNGLVCQSGAVALVTANTTITGAAGADFLVDGLPAVSEANFRAGAAPFCLKGPSSAIIQGSDTGFARNAANILTTTPLTITNAHQFIFEDATAGAKIINLPALDTARGQQLFIAKSDAGANTVTVTPDGAETIGGAASVVLASQDQGVWLIAPDSGTDWKVLAAGIPSAGGQVNIPAGLKAHDLQRVFGDSGYVALVTDFIIAWDTAGGACVQNLPALATVRGSIFKIAKSSTDGNAVTITPNGAETIGTAANLVLAGGAVRAAEIYAPLAGTDWLIL